MISGKLDSPHDFGRYTLIAKVAAGGMATVYRGHAKPGDPLEGRDIAVKILHEHLTDNDDFVRMFKDEGRIVRDLDHPNIVHVLDVGECDGRHYLAMEFVEGRDLAQVLVAHRLNSLQVPFPVAFEILRQALVALRYVHDHKGKNGRSLGIVHRDISPQNLLISREPLIKLTDFGIARGEHRTDRTKTGTIKGKMHYMAPEQAMGQRVDARADLYAMGAVAYELLTGQELFGAENTETLHLRASRGEISFGLKFERLPEDIKTWLKRALAVAPESRFQSADAMLAAMEQLNKASRTHYKAEVLVKLLDMEDARRSKQKVKMQKLIRDDAVASGRIQPGMVMQHGQPAPKVVATGARVELDGNQRVSRLGHDRRESKIDWNAKQDVTLRPVTAVRDLTPRGERPALRTDMLPAEAAHGRSYQPENLPAKKQQANAETLTPGSLARPARMPDHIQTGNVEQTQSGNGEPALKPKRQKPGQTPRTGGADENGLGQSGGLALSSAVAWSCAALLLFAVTQELMGTNLQMPEARDLQVASLWEDEPQPTRTDALARSGPHAQPPLVDERKFAVAPSHVRKTVLNTPEEATSTVKAPEIAVRKVAGGMLPVKPAQVVDVERAEAVAQKAVENHAELVAWEGRPVEHVEKPGKAEKPETAEQKPVKPVTFAEAKVALESAGKVVMAVAGYTNPPKAKRAPADGVAVVKVAAKAPVVPVPVAGKPAAAKPAVVAAKPAGIAAKPAVPAAKPIVAAAKPAVPSAKPVVAAAKPVAPAAKPPVPSAKPTVPSAKPVVAAAKPVAPGARPAPVAAKPPVALAKPVVQAKPPVVQAKPAVSSAKPAIVGAKPVVPAAKPGAAAGKPALGAKPVVPAVKAIAPAAKAPVSGKPAVPAGKAPLAKPVAPAVKPAVKPAAAAPAQKPVLAKPVAKPVVPAAKVPAVGQKPAAAKAVTK